MTDKIRGIVVAVECDSCGGEGYAYVDESSRFKSECESCKGTGEIHKTITVEAARALLVAESQ